MLLLYLLFGGLISGLLLGGRLSALADVRFRWWPIALGGLVFQAFLFSEPLATQVGSAGPALYVISTVFVLVALLRNIRLPWFAVIALGAGLNLAAILANGGRMPADPQAFAVLTGQPRPPTELFSNSTLAGPGTPLAFLGDIFVLPRPLPFANVFSIGDVLIGVGAALFLVWTMRRGTAAGAPTGIALDRAAARGR